MLPLVRGVQVGGYPQVPHTFARICGYVEQSDIHSPRVSRSGHLCLWLYLQDLQALLDFVSIVLRSTVLAVPCAYGTCLQSKSGASVSVCTLASELCANPGSVSHGCSEWHTQLNCLVAAFVPQTTVREALVVSATLR